MKGKFTYKGLSKKQEEFFKKKIDDFPFSASRDNLEFIVTMTRNVLPEDQGYNIQPKEETEYLPDYQGDYKLLHWRKGHLSLEFEDLYVELYISPDVETI